MKTLHLTVAMIADLGACPGSQERFEQRWPNGVSLTDDQGENFKILSPFADEPNIVWGENDDDAGYVYGACATYDVQWIVGKLDHWYGVAFHVVEPDHYDLFGFCGLLADAIGIYLKRGAKG